jgi:hypothetical protein
MRKLRRAMGLTVIAAMTAIVSCSAIFGLDPPTRQAGDANAPDADIDATIDMVVGDEHRDTDSSLDETVDASDEGDSNAGDGSVDAADASDAESGAIGIRCGFPDAQVFCPGGGSGPDAGVCCAESPTTFTCKTHAACQGFAIECDYDTCPAPRLCCKYMAHTTCQTAGEKCSTPGTTAQVCDPNDAGPGCPSGHSCGNAVMISGAPSPYHTCN